MRGTTRKRLLFGVGLAAVAALAAPGCVERRLIVRADVVGAKVYLDGEPQGETPCRIPFVFYGTREVIVRAPGRLAARRVVPLVPPWYEVTPVDFFAEVLWPGTIEDVHEVDLVLEAAPKADDASLKALAGRAEAMRAESFGPRASTPTAGAKRD